MLINQKARLAGVYAAVVTPFDRKQNIDFKWMTQHLAFLRNQGVDGIVVCGTNGEGTSLSVEERKRVVEHAFEKKQNLKLIVGAGFLSMTETAGFARFCDGFKPDALLVLPPFFDRSASVQGIADYYHYVADNCRTPILLYNIPQFSGVTITHSLLHRLAGVKNIIGVKDSTGDAASTCSFIKTFPDKLVFTGNDHRMAEGLRDGAVGCISGHANVFAAQVVQVWRDFKKGADTADAQFGLSALADQFDELPARAATKYALHLCGLPRTFVRPPEVELTDEQKAILTERLM